MNETHLSSRRQWFAIAGVGLGLTPIYWWLGGDAASAITMPGDTKTSEVFAVQKSAEEWRRVLSPAQFNVLREQGTERAGSSPLDAEKRAGTFVCAGCAQRLFTSDTKFESGTGWPSFYQPIPGGVGTRDDRSWFASRTEVHCSRCGGHLGHVFDDGPRPTGLRYCMNGVAMLFQEGGK